MTGARAMSARQTMPVRGHREDHDGLHSYVLDERISGYDSYRAAELVLAGAWEPGVARDRRTTVQVRVLTLDDVTIVSPLPGQAELPDRWRGTLVLPASTRGRAMPADLARALLTAGLDPAGLDPAGLDPAGDDVGARRHLVEFVAEARPGSPTRAARVAAAVDALRRAGAGGFTAGRARTSRPAGHRSALPPRGRGLSASPGRTPPDPAA
jgi:hypothetical protein